MAAARRLRLDRDWYLVLIAGALGMTIALAALAFILPIRAAERAVEHLLLTESRQVVIAVAAGLPVAGALAASVVLALFPVKGRGHGITQVLYAINRTQSAIPGSVAIRQWLGSSLIIASGGSAGPEGPIVTIGATLGSKAARALEVDRPATTTLLGCGAAAGIAAVFAAPMTGIFFVLEVLLRDFSLRTFTPIVVSAVLSFATVRAVLEDPDPVFGSTTEIMSRIGADISVSAVPMLAALALLCAGGAWLFIHAVDWTESLFLRLRMPRPLKPALGAAALGLGAALWLAMLGPGEVPPFMGAGYGAIGEILAGPMLHSKAPLVAAGLLQVWFLAKVAATAATLGSGGAGGLFAPALMAGAALGGAVGSLGAAAGAEQPTAAACALVGMGCMVAATTHAPMAGAMLVYELSHNETIILPALLCTVVATLAARALYPYSMYTAPLAAMGIRQGEMGDLTLLRRLTVADVGIETVPTIEPGASARALLQLAEEHALREVVVVDDRGRLAGLVTAADLQSVLVYREAAGALTVSDVMRANPPVTTPDETMDTVLQKLAACDVESVAVLHDRQGQELVGVITREQVVRAYDEALRSPA